MNVYLVEKFDISQLPQGIMVKTKLDESKVKKMLQRYPVVPMISKESIDELSQKGLNFKASDFSSLDVSDSTICLVQVEKKSDGGFNFWRFIFRVITKIAKDVLVALFEKIYNDLIGKKEEPKQIEEPKPVIELRREVKFDFSKLPKSKKEKT